MGVYLDYNASAPIEPRVLDYMIDVYRKNIGNADSRTHDFGDNARKIVEKARGEVASILKINKDEVFFTSGATESNNIAIQGLKTYGITEGKRHIITTGIEHKAVLETAKAMQAQGFEVDFVNPGIDGRVSVEQVLEKVRDDTLLVSVMHVNNETGIIQPVREIGECLAEKNVLFHVDATQSFGKLVEELQSLKYDMLSMSAHKIGGPQGVGALILRRKRYKLPPVKAIIYGGQQEHGIRPGTIPVALVAALGYACNLAEEEYKTNQKKCKAIRNRLIGMLSNSGLNYEFNGNQEYCVSSTINICINGVVSEALMLSSKAYCGISNGSACNSNSYEPSYVLSAMGLSSDRTESSIRISWGPDADIGEVTKSFNSLIEVTKGLVW
ncbi:cysteine desulfurase family protein [Mediterraneibacter agrestimuris]|uniref:cysteine desulfurase family protein n=1 Tax=Mediterraneibacter agrestimuris TaxID=2941333 RepID=UPI00203C7851|nr:aminotransferase class V-fold PLP-dependent enzyme [Mediterraneibacter agrestimuris]